MKYFVTVYSKSRFFFLQKNQAEGRQNQLAITVADLKKEMAKPYYKNAIKNYKDKMIKLMVRDN